MRTPLILAPLVALSAALLLSVALLVGCPPAVSPAPGDASDGGPSQVLVDWAICVATTAAVDELAGTMSPVDIAADCVRKCGGTSAQVNGYLDALAKRDNLRAAAMRKDGGK